MLIALWACIYLPRLGHSGLSMSEGHRAIPAWEMLGHGGERAGGWVVPRMFERAYLRKPPGVQWAIAGSSAVFGQTTFAARLPSALAVLALAGACGWCARRWFGPGAGGPAALAAVLMPLLVSPGRSAEIESMHNAACALAALLLLDGAVRGRVASGVLAGLALAAAGLFKGPAGLPVLAGVVLAGALTPGALARAWRGWAVAALVAAAVLVPIGLIIRREASILPDLVSQGPGEFLWDPSRLGGIALLMPAALASALPASLALLFPWGPDARREDAGPRSAARLVGLAVLLGLGVFVLAGVSNPRYTQPALAACPVLVGWVVLGARGAFVPHRARIARAMLFGRASALAAVLLAGCVGYAQWSESRRVETSGAAAGAALGALIARDAEVWADHAIEARPEVLEALRSAAASRGVRARVRWMPMGPDALPPAGSYVLLRADAGSGELARAEAERWPLRRVNLPGKEGVERVEGFAFVLLERTP